MRTYDSHIFAKLGLTTDWLQENESYTARRYTIRGLHFQHPPYSETKLVRVVRGAILDVFVDLRTQSATFRRWGILEVSAERHNMVYIPRGLAHGFCTLVDDCIVSYKVDEVYHPDAEGGVRWDDPALGITWPSRTPTLSDRDRALPSLDDVTLLF